MDRLLSNQNGGFPFNLDDLRWILGESNDNIGIYRGIESLFNAWKLPLSEGGQASFVEDFIVLGIEPYYGGYLTEGWIMYQGELYFCEGGTLASLPNLEIYYKREETTTRTFKDNTNKNIYLKRRVQISQTVPSGVDWSFPFDNIKNIRFSDIISTKMKATSNEVQTGSDDIKFLTSKSLKDATAVGLKYPVTIGTSSDFSDVQLSIQTHWKTVHKIYFGGKGDDDYWYATGYMGFNAYKNGANIRIPSDYGVGSGTILYHNYGGYFKIAMYPNAATTTDYPISKFDNYVKFQLGVDGKSSNNIANTINGVDTIIKSSNGGTYYTSTSDFASGGTESQIILSGGERGYLNGSVYNGGVGSSISLIAGKGGQANKSTNNDINGNGGNINLYAGDGAVSAGGNDVPGIGGNILLYCGVGSKYGGSMELKSGNGSGYGGIAGNITIKSGEGTGKDGNIILKTGTNTTPTLNSGDIGMSGKNVYLNSTNGAIKLVTGLNSVTPGANDIGLAANNILLKGTNINLTGNVNMMDTTLLILALGVSTDYTVNPTNYDRMIYAWSNGITGVIDYLIYYNTSTDENRIGRINGNSGYSILLPANNGLFFKYVSGASLTTFIRIASMKIGK